MKQWLIRILIFIIPVWMFSSCRKKVNDPAEINIISPLPGSAFSPGDTIKVEATMSDDDELGTATLKILNASYTPVNQQQSISMSGVNSYHLEADYIIDNPYLESGNYFFAITVSDGNEDET